MMNFLIINLRRNKQLIVLPAWLLFLSFTSSGQINPTTTGNWRCGSVYRPADLLRDIGSVPILNSNPQQLYAFPGDEIKFVILFEDFDERKDTVCPFEPDTG